MAELDESKGLSTKTKMLGVLVGVVGVSATFLATWLAQRPALFVVWIATLLALIYFEERSRRSKQPPRPES